MTNLKLLEEYASLEFKNINNIKDKVILSRILNFIPENLKEELKLAYKNKDFDDFNRILTLSLIKIDRIVEKNDIYNEKYLIKNIYTDEVLDIIIFKDIIENNKCMLYSNYL